MLCHVGRDWQGDQKPQEERITVHSIIYVIDADSLHPLTPKPQPLACVIGFRRDEQRPGSFPIRCKRNPQRNFQEAADETVGGRFPMDYTIIGSREEV